MYKKCKLVLLNTNKEPKKGDILLRHIWKDTKIECKSLWQYNETVVIQDVKQYTTLNGSFRDIYTSFIPQHLYILSDDEIKEGDFYFSGNRFTNDNLSKFKVGISSTEFYKEQSIKKIIASTNTDLIKEGIASINDYFIKQYCNNPTEEVLVEYEKTIGDKYIPGYNFDLPEANEIVIKPKLSYNGSIIINPVEETWGNILDSYYSRKDMSILLVEWLTQNYQVPNKK